MEPGAAIEPPTVTNALANEAVIVAETAVVLAEGTAAIANQQAAQVIIENEQRVSEVEREIEWNGERFQAMETRLAAMEASQTGILEQLLTVQTMLTPPALPLEPEAEAVIVEPGNPSESVEVENPVALTPEKVRRYRLV